MCSKAILPPPVLVPAEPRWWETNQGIAVCERQTVCNCALAQDREPLYQVPLMEPSAFASAQGDLDEHSSRVATDAMRQSVPLLQVAAPVLASVRPTSSNRDA